MITDNQLINQTDNWAKESEERVLKNLRNLDLSSFCNQTDDWINESNERLLKYLQNLDLNPVLYNDRQEKSVK